MSRSIQLITCNVKTVFKFAISSDGTPLFYQREEVEKSGDIDNWHVINSQGRTDSLKPLV